MEKFLALNASAGSGKTYALTLRYISLLFLNINPNTILTLTFTNKAASEMSDRILKTLLALGDDLDILNEISNQTGKSIDKILLDKSTIIDMFLSSEIFIITLDTFINKILREFSGYIDINDDFKIDNDDYDLMLYKFLLSLDPKDFDNLINFSHTNDKKLNSIIDLFLILDDKNYDYKYINFSEDILCALTNDIISDALKIKEFILGSDLSNSAINAVDFNDILSLLEKGKTWLIKTRLGDYSYFKKAKIDDNIETLFNQLKMNLSFYFKYKEINILNNLFVIFNNFRSFRYQYKKEKNSLQFNDVTNLAYMLLQKYIDKDFLSFRLDATFNHILIDEFQDTSVIQYKILEPLIDEILSGQSDDLKLKTFFYVGDVKQSIYRFRGGKKELFNYVANKFNENIKVKILDKNFRSSRHIVSFVNGIFTNQNEYEYYHQKVNSKIDGYVETLEINIDTTDITKDKFEFLKFKLEDLLEKGINPNSIAILTYTNNDVLEIYDYLKDNFKDLKIVTDMTSKLINQKYIKAIVNLIKYIYFKNDIYKANFNSIMGYGIENDISFDFCDCDLDVMSLVKNISTHYEILEDNVLKFIESLSQYEDIVDFIYDIDKNDTTIINKENDGLQILTIFKSKGLEFDTVLLLDRMKNKNTDKSTLLFSYNNIALEKIYYKDKLREDFDLNYKNAVSEEKKHSLNDELNVLYVALTRARYNLIIFSKPKQSVFDILDSFNSKFKIGELYFGNNEKKDITCENNTIEYKTINLGKQELEKNGELEESDDLKARYFGLATHYCLEMMIKFDLNSLQSALSMTINKYDHILTKDDFAQIEQKINLLINDKRFTCILNNSEYKKEQSLIYNNELKIIDLLLKKEDYYVVIDYKTTTNNEPNHIEQVKNYMKYIKDITLCNTLGYLVYLRQNRIEIVEVSNEI